MSVLISCHHHYAMDQPSTFIPVPTFHNTQQLQQTQHQLANSTSTNAQQPFDFTQRPDTYPPPPRVTVSTSNPHAIAIPLTPHPYPLSPTAAASHETHSPIPLPAAPLVSSSSAAAPPSQPTLCPNCNTHIHPVHLDDHLHLERKQLAGEPLTPSDRLALQHHGVRARSPPEAPAPTRASRRSNASRATAAPTKPKAKAMASASVSSTLGQYKLLVEGVATRRRTRAAAAAAATAAGVAQSGRLGGIVTPGRASTASSLAPSPASSRRTRTSGRKPHASRTSSSSAASAAMLVDPESNDWSAAASADLGSVVCPICTQYVVGDELAVNAHIDACLANPGSAAAAGGAMSVESEASGSESRDDEDDVGASTDDDPAMYEPLPVAPPRPLPSSRAPAAASAGYSPPPSRAMSAAGRASDSDDDDDDDDDGLDLDIDADPSADRTATYGSAQFTELDVLPYSVAIHGANDLALQSLVAATAGEDADAVRKRILEQADAVAKRVQCQMPTPVTTAGMSAAERAEALTVEALKERVAHLERLTQETPRCKVCWEGLGGKAGAPVVSVACWHVHCRECWLQSLGYRKVCPQCLVITRPEDLRKVYI